MENKTEPQLTNGSSPQVPLYKKISKYIYSAIFDLPFANYYEYYKNGKIQNMSKDEKHKLVLEMNKETQYRQFFKRLLRLRPAFMDDEDVFYYNITQNKIKNYRSAIIIGLFFNWNFFAYYFFVKKRNIYKFFISVNLILIVMYLRVNKYENRKYEELFEKYKNVIKKDEVFKIMKEAYRID